jgi:hypothetical protein
MLRSVKRRRVDDEEVSENESKLSEPSTSKAEEKVIDKISPLQRQLLGRGFYMDWTRKLSASIVHFSREELSNTAMVPAELSRHFTNNPSHLLNKNIDYFQLLLDS